MKRTLIDISEDALSKLNLIAKNRKVSRAYIIRSAIDKLLKESSKQGSVDEAFGICKSSQINSIELQKHLRSEWR